MKVLLRNKKSSFLYELLKTFSSGIILTGSEVKSLREGKGNIGDAYCYFTEKGLYLKSLYIPEYKPAGRNNHQPYRERKLLLTKQELNLLKKKMEQKGLTIVPVSIYLNDKCKIKVDIALAKGKNLYDKRVSLKDKEQQREVDRQLKQA